MSGRLGIDDVSPAVSGGRYPAKAVTGEHIPVEATVWREFDFAAGLLADGRRYLCGDRFGAADLTFAALSAAVIVPPRYGVALPQPGVLPPHTAALVERAREHPAGRFALSLFSAL